MPCKHPPVQLPRDHPMSGTCRQGHRQQWATRPPPHHQLQRLLVGPKDLPGASEELWESQSEHCGLFKSHVQGHTHIVRILSFTVFLATSTHICTVPPKCKLTVFCETSIETRSSILARIEDRGSSRASSLSRMEKVMSLSLDWFLEKLILLIRRHALQGIAVARAKDNCCEKVLDITTSANLRPCSSSEKKLATR